MKKLTLLILALFLGLASYSDHVFAMQEGYEPISESINGEDREDEEETKDNNDNVFFECSLNKCYSDEDVIDFLTTEAKKLENLVANIETNKENLKKETDASNCKQIKKQISDDVEKLKNNVCYITGAILKKFSTKISDKRKKNIRKLLTEIKINKKAIEAPNTKIVSAETELVEIGTNPNDLNDKQNKILVSVALINKEIFDGIEELKNKMLNKHNWKICLKIIRIALIIVTFISLVVICPLSGGVGAGFIAYALYTQPIPCPPCGEWKPCRMDQVDYLPKDCFPVRFNEKTGECTSCNDKCFGNTTLC